MQNFVENAEQPFHSTPKKPPTDGICEQLANIYETSDNLFESSRQTIVNTVNCVGVMGRGIALEFKYRYPEMYLDYRQKCARHFFKPGVLDVWKHSDHPWILNFPTKDHWKFPSKTEYIKLGLQKFAETYVELGITTIAFPPLGTTSGGLDWDDDVSSLMDKYLQPLDNLDVDIVHYDPDADDSFFEKFYEKVSEFGVADYQEHIRLKKPQATRLKDAINSGEIKTMLGLQGIPGLGAKSFEYLYEFANQPFSTPNLFSTKEYDPEIEEEILDH